MSGRTAATIVIPVVFLGYFFVYPLASILLTGLGGGDAGSAFGEVLTDPVMRSVAWFTLWQAVVSTALTLLVGIPGAYVFARYDFPGRGLFRALTLVPFVLPTLAVATAMLSMFGATSPIDLRGTVWIILIAHVFYNLAIVIRGVGSFWEQIDPRLEEASRMLGASRFKTFTEVTLPLLRPAILSAASLVFLFTFTSFGVVLVLGDLTLTTIEVEIWRQTTAFARLDIAAALAILQLLGVAAILFAYSRSAQARQLQLPYRSPAETVRRPQTADERLFVGATLAVLTAIVIVPIAVLVARSLSTRDGIGLDHYADLFSGATSAAVSVPEAIGNTLWFGLAAVMIATLIGVLAAASIAYERGWVGRVFDTTLMLPLGASAVMIGFGFLVALDEPVDLRTWVLLIPIAHSLVAIPFVVRSAVPAMRSVQQRLREAAAVLGASPAAVWREIDLPIIGRAMAVGAAFAFAVSVGEFGATAFIVRPESTTMPVAIFRLLGRPGNFGEAMALSVLLMALTAVAALTIEAIRGAAAGDL